MVEGDPGKLDRLQLSSGNVPLTLEGQAILGYTVNHRYVYIHIYTYMYVCVYTHIFKIVYT